MAAPDRRLNPRGDPWSIWLHIDVLLIAAALSLAGLGAAMIFSATRGTDPAAYNTFFLERQAMFIILGIALMVATILIPYERFRDFAPVIYAGGILLLILVLSPLGTGREDRGAQAWFSLGGFQFQPSEVLKIGYIVMLARYLGDQEGSSLSALQLIKALAIGATPLALIMLQPDVGTALVYVSITMGMLLIGGARLRHIVLLTFLGVLGIVAILNSSVLAEYQRDRLVSFVNPDETSQQGAAYHQNQAQIAIGSGGLSGQGFGNGGQTRGEFVPEQHTDFIFTVVGEELGFIGAALLLSLFGIMVWRSTTAARQAADPFGSLVSIGVLCMFVFQMFQTAGMNMGVMPITGIPMPFVSYGGSSTLTSFIAVGLVANINMRRHKVAAYRRL